jgi:thermitase
LGESTPLPTESESTPSATPALAISPTPTNTPQPTDVPAETPVEQTLLLVGLARTTSVERFEASIDYPVVDIGLDALGIYAVRVPEAQADEIMGSLSRLPEVRCVEPNYTVTAQDTLPNDPAFAFQYALVNIRAPQAWDITTGSNAVTIAIVDSGVDLSHPELASKLLPGYDFVNGDTIPQDDNGHGTHVAGIAAAASNNGLGMVGVSWGARILPVKVLNAFNSGTYANVAAGIVWAANQGAQVINLSLGGPNSSQTLQEAIEYAASRGVALTAAAGNTGGAILYPARYPAVIAVANTNAANQRVPSSAFGPEIDLAAPGAGIYSLAIGGGYTTLGGTSMSTPHVSGALALLLSLPGVSTGQARAYLEASALDIDAPGWDVFTGYGLIQIDAALRLALPPPATTPAPIPSLTTVAGPNPTFAPGFPPGINATFTPLQTRPAGALPSASLTVSETLATSIFFTPTAANTPTVTSTPFPTKSLTKFGQIPWTPCLGVLLILLGILLAILARRQWQKSTT